MRILLFIFMLLVATGCSQDDVRNIDSIEVISNEEEYKEFVKERVYRYSGEVSDRLPDAIENKDVGEIEFLQQLSNDIIDDLKEVKVPSKHKKNHNILVELIKEDSYGLGYYKSYVERNKSSYLRKGNEVRKDKGMKMIQVLMRIDEDLLKIKE
jgi:hypothetical protein